MPQVDTFRTDLIEQYLRSKLSEEDFLATLSPDEQKAYENAKTLVRRAVIAELATQISRKPTKSTNSQGRMGRVARTQSSSSLD